MPAMTQQARDYDQMLLAKKNLEFQKNILELQKLQNEDPNYQIERAGNLATKAEDIQGLIGNLNDRTTSNKQRLADIASSITPLPNNVSGPVVPESAMQGARQDIELQVAADNSVKNRLRAQLEAINKQQEGLQGSVNLGEAYGTSAPAGINDVLMRRAQDFATMKQMADNWVGSAQTPQEQSARMAAVQSFKPLYDAETRRRQKQALELPGLQGQALDEDAAKKARDKTTDFVGSVKALDLLMQIKPEQWSQITNPIEREGQRRKADTLRAALVGNLRIAIAGPGQLSEYERKIIESAIANPASFDPIQSMYAGQNLAELKKILATKYVSDMSTYGYKVGKLQDVVDAGGNPPDLDTFGYGRPQSGGDTQGQKAVGRFDPATGKIVPIR